MVISLGEVEYLQVAIASGAQVSDVFPTKGMSPCGIYLPATLTSTALTFAAAPTLIDTLNPIYNKSGQVSYTIAGGQFIAIAPVDFYGVQFLQFQLGSIEGAARTLICAMKGM